MIGAIAADRIPRHDTMLLAIGVLLAAGAVVAIYNSRWPGSGGARELGWMSEHWLAEHRASESA